MGNPGGHGMGFNHWLVAHAYAETTIRYYLFYVNRAAAHLDLATATTADLFAYMLTLPESPSIRLGTRKALNAYYRSTGTEPNPAAGLPKVRDQDRLPRPLSRGDQLRWLTAARDLGGFHHLVAVMFSTTGARITEVRTARWENITLERPGSWRICGKGADRRGPKWRDAPLHPALLQLLLEWPRESPWLFPGRTGRPIADSTMRNRVLQISEHAGLGRVLPHAQRHTAATTVLTETGDLRLTQEFLGHATPASTAIYTKVLPERLRAAVDVLPA